MPYFDVFLIFSSAWNFKNALPIDITSNYRTVYRSKKSRAKITLLKNFVILQYITVQIVM